MITPSAGTGVFLIKANDAAPTFEKVPIALGGTGVTTKSALSDLLGLGTATTETNYIVTYNPIPVGRGGTGVTSYGDLNTKLGLATDVNGNIASGAQVSNAISIQRGGTGATNVMDARTNLNVVNKSGDLIENDFVLNGRLYIKNDKVSPNITQYDVTERFKTIETNVQSLNTSTSTIPTLTSNLDSLATRVSNLEQRVAVLENK
jgi:hypothetical protein